MPDNSMSLLPGANPTGGPRYGEGFVPGAGTSSGSNPMLLPPNLPGSAPQSNPYGTSVVPSAPVFGANTGGGYSTTNLLGPLPPGTTDVSSAKASPVGGINLMSTKDLSRLFDSLKKTYGDGTAHAILDFLSSGAGFNQGAINNLLAALQPGIERGTESLMEQFSTSGNRFGSGAQIGLGDFLSQVNLNEGQLETQMYEDAVSNYMNVLLGAGKNIATTKANSPSFLDNLTSIFSGVTSGAQGASGLLSAISPNIDTGILDAIGALAI